VSFVASKERREEGSHVFLASGARFSRRMGESFVRGLFCRDSLRVAGEVTLFGPGEDLDRVKRLAEMDVTRVVPMFPPEKADTVLPIVDRWTSIMRQVNR